MTGVDRVAPEHARTVAHVLVPLGALASLLPFVSSGLALIAGTAVGLTLGNPFARATRTLSRKLLALSVIGLGADMDLGAILRTGAGGASYSWSLAGRDSRARLSGAE